MGIKLLPPDINKSDADFKLEREPDGKMAIRYALAAVKSVGMAAMQAVVACRGMSSFEDLADFAARDCVFIPRGAGEVKRNLGDRTFSYIERLGPDRRHLGAMRDQC